VGADIGITHITPTVIAARGERLALSRVRYQGQEAFLIEILAVVEINTDNRIAAAIVFDVDDIDAAFAELDARYLAGEAAAHARTWAVVAQAFGSLSRHELPATTPDWVNIDHRRGIAFAAGDAAAYIGAWNAGSGSVHVETVHRLSNIGAVVTHVGTGTSPGGFDAEWREISLVAVDGDRINRAEVFDEAAIDTALARFDELNRPAP
jgi:hypothetical protein